MHISAGFLGSVYSDLGNLFTPFKKSRKRGIIVLAAGIAVSLVTAVIMPAMGITGAEIYFGILSCLGCSMIITGFLMPLINKGNEKIGLLLTAFLFFATYKISEKIYFSVLFSSLMLCIKTIYSTHSVFITALLNQLIIFL